MKRPKKGTLNKPALPVWALVLFLLSAWQILLWAQNPGLMSDDSGEMVAASYRLGLPHPPGYPLYCLLGRLFSLMRVGSIAFRFNLLASLIALLSVLVLMKTCRELWPALGRFAPRKSLSGTAMVFLAGAAMLFCRSFFAQSLTAKGLVYLMTFFIISLLVWWRVKSAVDPAGAGLFRKKYFILFLFVLGFASHWQTQVLLVPFMILWCYQERVRWSSKSVLVGSSLSLMALSPYLYLPLRAALIIQPKWGDPVTLKEFIWVVARKLSSNTETWVRSAGHYALWLGEYFHLMATCWWGWFWILGLVGAVLLFRIQRKLFWSLAILYVVVLYSLIAVPRDEVLFLMNVYLVSVHGVFVLVLFLGGSLLVGLAGQKSRAFAWFLIAGLVISVMSWGFRIGKEEDKSRYTLAEDFGTNILKGLPKNSILLAEGDHAVMPLWYLQYAQGLRPDVVIKPAVFLLHDWGWRQMSTMVSEIGAFTKPGNSFRERLIGMTELSGKRPFFYTYDRQYLKDELRELPGVFTPTGLTYQWSAFAVPGELAFRKGWELGRAQRLRGLDLFRSDHQVDVSTNEIYRYYANQYFEAGQYLQSAGRVDLALRDFDRGLFFYSDTAWVYSNMAVLFGREGYFELARRLCGKAIEANPGYLPSYLNLANTYRAQHAMDKARAVYEWAIEDGLDTQGMKERIREMGNAPIPAGAIVKDKGADGYRKLSESLQVKGLLFLSDLALKVAEDMASGKTRKTP